MGPTFYDPFRETNPLYRVVDFEPTDHECLDIILILSIPNGELITCHFGLQWQQQPFQDTKSSFRVFQRVFLNSTNDIRQIDPESLCCY